MNTIRIKKWSIVLNLIIGIFIVQLFSSELIKAESIETNILKKENQKIELYTLENEKAVLKGKIEVVQYHGLIKENVTLQNGIVSLDKFKIIMGKIQYDLPEFNFNSEYILMFSADEGPMQGQVQKINISAILLDKGKLVNSIKEQELIGEPDKDGMYPFVMFAIPKSALE